MTEDLDGVELPSVTDAELEAIKAAREIIAEYVLLGEVIEGQGFEIADNTGAVVATVPFQTVLRLD